MIVAAAAPILQRPVADRRDGFALAVSLRAAGAEFIAAAQLVVYCGAIMVLFVFVIMLLNAAVLKRWLRRQRYFNYVLGVPALVIC